MATANRDFTWFEGRMFVEPNCAEGYMVWWRGELVGYVRRAVSNQGRNWEAAQRPLPGELPDYRGDAATLKAAACELVLTVLDAERSGSEQ